MFWGPGGPIFFPLCDLSLLCLGNFMCLSLPFVSFIKYSLFEGTVISAFESGSWRWLGWAGLLLLLLLFFFFFSTCNSPPAPVFLPHSLIRVDLFAFVCFVLFVLFCFFFFFCFVLFFVFVFVFLFCFCCFVLFCFCFVLFRFVFVWFFAFGIPPHAGLGDRDAGPAISREHGHLGTMGEQCCALNGLPRFVNKNE